MAKAQGIYKGRPPSAELMAQGLGATAIAERLALLVRPSTGCWLGDQRAGGPSRNVKIASCF